MIKKMPALIVDQIVLIATIIVCIISFIAVVRLYPLLTAIALMIWGWVSYSLIDMLSISGLLSKIMLYLDEIFVLVFFLMTFAGKLYTKSIKPSTLDILFSGFIFSGCVSAFLNHVPIKIAVFGMFMVTKGYLLYWSVINKNESINTNYIIKPFKAFGFIILLGAAVEFVAPTLFRNFFNLNLDGYTYRFGLLELRSFFTTSSVYGWFMSISALYYFSTYTIENKRRSGVLIFVYSFFILLSLRAKAVFSTIVSMILFFISIPTRKRKKSLSLLIVLFFLFFSFSAGDTILNLISMQFEKYIINVNTSDVARNVLLRTSIKIANENFPFGAGFGRFGGNIAQQYYSPLYYKYGLNSIYGLDKNGKFLNDTFWPCIVGESGYIGTIFYFLLLSSLFFRHITILKKNKITNLAPGEQIFYMWSLLVLIAAIVDSVAQPIFTRNPQYFLIFFTLGHAYRLSERS